MCMENSVLCKQSVFLTTQVFPPAPGPTYHKYTLPPVMLLIEGKHSDRSIYTLRAVYTVPVIFGASQLAMQSLSFLMAVFFSSI